MFATSYLWLLYRPIQETLKYSMQYVLRMLELCRNGMQDLSLMFCRKYNGAKYVSVAQASVFLLYLFYFWLYSTYLMMEYPSTV